MAVRNRDIFGMTVLGWLGQEHANYNMGLFAPGIAAKYEASDIRRLLEAVARETGAAAALLRSQPFSWEGVANPFALLPHQAAPSYGYAVTLGDFEALVERRFGKHSRSNFQRKERKLGEIAPLDLWLGGNGARRGSRSWTRCSRRNRANWRKWAWARSSTTMRAPFIASLHLLEGDNPSRLRLGYLKTRRYGRGDLCRLDLP